MLKNKPGLGYKKHSLITYTLLLLLILIPSFIVLNMGYNRICKSIEYMSVGNEM